VTVLPGTGSGVAGKADDAWRSIAALGLGAAAVARFLRRKPEMEQEPEPEEGE